MQETNKIVPIDEYLTHTLGPRGDRALEDPRLAGEVSRRLAAEPSPDGVFAPICLASPSDVAPVAYVVHNFSQTCQNCTTNHRWSEVFALNHLRSRSGSSFIRHLVPVQRIEWQVPVRIHALTPKAVPVCFECVDALDLSKLPVPPVPQLTVKATEGSGVASASARAKKPAPTLDDIL
jgi:hypothetical protein